MKHKNFNIRQYAVKFMAIILIIAYAFTLYVVDHIETSKNSEIKTALELKEIDKLDSAAQIFSFAYATVLSDIHFLKHVIEEEQLDKAHISGVMIHFMESNTSYDQMRYIDTEGMERIRIDNVSDEIILKPVTDLQDKSGRYYVEQGLSLSADALYISKMDLNVENQNVEIPYKPMIRFIAPIYEEDTLKGIIVINYKLEAIFEIYKQLTDANIYDTYILNSDSYYLYGEGEAKLWGFMFDEGMDWRFSVLNPAIWQEMKLNESGVLTSETGGYIFKCFDIGSYVESDSEALHIGELKFEEPALYFMTYITQDYDLGYLYNDYKTDDLMRLITTYKFLFIAEFIIILFVIPLVISRRIASEKIVDISEHDALTGLYNRGTGYEKLEKMLKNVRKTNDVMALCFVDVNGLKAVNDGLGHERGDALIKKVADLLAGQIRDGDIVCRFGGDEFVIGVRHTSSQKVDLVWQRILNEIKTFNATSNCQFIISLSHGVSLSSEISNNDLDELIKLADERMYREKKIIKRSLNVLKSGAYDYMI